MKIRPRLASLPAMLAAFAVASIAALPAAPELPSVFSDHMVLQQTAPVPVWGKANPGEKITVAFAGQKKTADANAEGRWSVHLDAMPASAESREMTITGGDKEVKISDILVGEVWLASGQSNMEWTLAQIPAGKAEIRTANSPQIRFIKAEKVSVPAPAADIKTKAKWTVCSPKTIGYNSAIGYYFAKKLNAELKVPVGIIDSSWGGTAIEPWIAPEGFASVPALAQVKGSNIYNGMIAPVAPYALRGVIWYQGESNILREGWKTYADKMAALVQGWRQVWQRDLAFYYVQIAPFMYHVNEPHNYASPADAALLREAQSDAMRLPHTGMVVTTDLADNLFNIHPANKHDVAERLARWALTHDYGKTGIECSGPVFRTMRVEGNRAILSFDNIGGGLECRAKNGRLSWFVVAGDDGVIYPAQAVIEGDNVVVTSPKVSSPKLVRFGWDEVARPNFYNKAGLPAVPFRTDRPAK